MDIRVRLDSLRLRELHADRLHYSPVHITPAGVALGIARQAVHCFDRVALISRIGRDEFTEAILAELALAGIEPRLTLVDGMATGRVVVVRDDGVRLMVAEPLSAQQVLTPADVRASSRAIASADVLFLTGYELLYPGSTEAVLEAAAIARSSGTLVCLDLVPHDLHLRLDPRQWPPVLDAADIVIGELSILSALAGAAHATLDQLLACLDPAAPAPVWLIRSGAGNVSRSTIYHRGLVHRDYETGYEEVSEPMGFGDRITAGELRWLLSAWPLSSRSARGSSRRRVARNNSRVAGVP
ncbi:carbohydrate kinase family protein [Nonomuraea sp. NPDC002799]